MMGILVSSVVSVGQANATNTGRASLRKATEALGTANLHGEATNGQPCDLAFQDESESGVLVGEPILGMYTLTVGGSETPFYFLDETTVTSSAGAVKFETIQRVAGEDSPDEGGSHRGFTDSFGMSVLTAGDSITVKITNGPSTTCHFKL